MITIKDRDRLYLLFSPNGYKNLKKSDGGDRENDGRILIVSLDGKCVQCTGAAKNFQVHPHSIQKISSRVRNSQE